MKDCYYKDVQEQTKPQNEANFHLYKSIHSSLEEMSVEIINTLMRCQSMQVC